MIIANGSGVDWEEGWCYDEEGLTGKRRCGLAVLFLDLDGGYMTVCFIIIH